MKGEDETKVEDTPRAIAEKMSDEAIEEVAEMQGELGNTTSAALIRDYLRLRRLVNEKGVETKAKDASDTSGIESVEDIERELRDWNKHSFLDDYDHEWCISIADRLAAALKRRRT